MIRNFDDLKPERLFMKTTFTLSLRPLLLSVAALHALVPTLEEAGVKGYEMNYWFAAYVPAATPPEVVDKLNEMLVKAARSSSAAGFYQSTGTEIFTSTPAELGKFQAAESLKWGRIIKAAGIESE